MLDLYFAINVQLGAALHQLQMQSKCLAAECRNLHLHWAYFVTAPRLGFFLPKVNILF